MRLFADTAEDGGGFAENFSVFFGGFYVKVVAKENYICLGAPSQRICGGIGEVNGRLWERGVVRKAGVRTTTCIINSMMLSNDPMDLDWRE